MHRIRRIEYTIAWDFNHKLYNTAYDTRESLDKLTYLALLFYITDHRPRIKTEMDASLEDALTSALSITTSAQSRLVKHSPSLEAALHNSQQQDIPPIAIGPAEGQYLSILCRLIGAKHILEIGTLGGYSTLWFVDSVPGVKVTSIEINPRHRDVALQNIKASPSAENAEVILGAALDVLPALSTEGRVFDFVFIGKLLMLLLNRAALTKVACADADWNEQAQYFEWAVKLTRPHGCIFVDNAFRQLSESAAEENAEFGEALIKSVEVDIRVTATLIPTLGTHRKTKLLENIDGFLMAIVN